MPFLKPIAIAFFVATLPFPQLSADEFVRVPGIALMDWNNPSYWINMTPGGLDEDGIPDSDDVTIFESITLTTDGSTGSMVIAPNVNVVAQVGTIRIGNADVAGSIHNAGKMSFELSNSSLPEIFEIIGDVTLDGGGEILLLEEDDSFLGRPLQFDSHLLNLDNTIRGRGSVDVLLENHSVIRAEQGTLRLGRGAINSSSGTIEIGPSATLQITGGMVTGGTVLGMPGATVDGTGFNLISSDLFGELLFSNSGIDDAANFGVLKARSQSNVDSILFLKNTIENFGTLTFEALGGISFEPENIAVIGRVELRGGGDLIMADEDSSRILGTSETSELINVDNVISGAGDINCFLENQHQILVEGGLMLMLETLNNERGSIQIASDGRLSGNGAFDLIGGTIIGTPGSRISNANLFDVETQGQLVITGVRIAGSLHNSGVLRFPDSSSGGSLRVDGEVLLTGGGQILMVDDFGSNIFTNDDNALLINKDHSILGTGRLRIPIQNESLIGAQFDVMTIEDDINNTNGFIEITSSGSLLIEDDITVTGGVITGASGAQISGGVLDGVTLRGDHEHFRDSTQNEMQFRNAIHNEGRFSFGNDSMSERIVISGEVHLGGGGELIMFNSADSLGFVSAFNPLLVISDQTIRGSGIIQVPVRNESELFADSALGELRYIRNVELTEQSVLSVLLNGPGFESSGQHVFETTTILNGTLQLVIGDSFDAELGDRYTVVTAPDFLESDFANIVTVSGPSDDGMRLVFEAEFVGGEVQVVVSDEILVGDVNHDGAVDLLDVATFIQILMDGQYVAQADVNGDGRVDLQDVSQFVALLG